MKSQSPRVPIAFLVLSLLSAIAFGRQSPPNVLLIMSDDQGYGDLPVCMAKTQYSFTTDPNRRGAPTGHSLPVREVRLSAGAGFIVVICGEIMTMPGLPRKPSAEAIMLNDEGQIEGLF